MHHQDASWLGSHLAERHVQQPCACGRAGPVHPRPADGAHHQRQPVGESVRARVSQASAPAGAGGGRFALPPRIGRLHGGGGGSVVVGLEGGRRGGCGRRAHLSERSLGFGPEFAGHTVSGTMRAQPKCQPSQNLHLKTKRHSPRRQCPKNPQRRPPPGPCSTSPLAYWTIPGRCLVQGTRRDVPCGVRTQHPQHPVSRDISLTPRSYRDTVNHRLLWQRCDWETTAVCTQLCVGPPSPGVAGTTSLWTGSCPVRHHARPVASCSFAIRGSAVCACGRSFDVARDAMSAVEAAALTEGVEPRGGEVLDNTHPIRR